MSKRKSMIMSHTNPSVMKKKKIHMLANAFATPNTLLHAIYGETKIKKSFRNRL